MAFAYSSFVDARYSTFNDVGRDQYNMVFNGQDSLDKLDPINMQASRRPECLAGTRQDILKFIVDWVNDPASQQNVLWLHGLAGSGKSTISTTIASVFRGTNRLAAFLFFSRDLIERSDPTIVIKTLAHQLAASDPQFGAKIRLAIQRDPNIVLSPISYQFQKLIIDVLSTAEIPPPPIVIVLDALDECGTPEEREALLTVLAEKSVHFPLNIRAIITSRGEIDIHDALELQHHVLTYELDITSKTNSDDILSYFRYRMTLIRTKKKHLRLSKDWPGEEILYQLVQRASGLFIWASTVSEFINGHDPRKRLGIILDGEVASGAEAALDALYKTALESVGLWDDEDFVTDFRDILGVVLVARQPLSSAAIDAVLGLSDDRPSIYTISLLGCVLQPHPTVRILHPSFADFLMTKERCKRDLWFFDRSTYHQHLAIQCLKRMDVVLKRNMCNMSLSIDLAGESLPEDVSYACVFWIVHTCSTDSNSPLLMERLHAFLSRHLLHWFEAMSIVRRSRDTIALLERLLVWISTRSPDAKNSSRLVRDACRFAHSFAGSIEDHPLLVYMGAMPFTPTGSTLYQTYHEICSFPSISGGFEQDWSPLLLVLAEHDNPVCSAAFSPDGTKILSGSWDNTIRIWDATSGAQLIPALRGHERVVISVSFSPDGSRIISGSSDKTVRVWDPSSGTEVLPALRGHEDDVFCVAFSPDGKCIVSGSKDQTIRVWDVASGTEKVSPFRGHAGVIRSAVFSPDGRRIVSGAHDTTIRIWDISSGIGEVLRGHEAAVSAVVFSPDGTRIVSCSYDKTIRVWDSTSGTEILPALQGHTDMIMSVAFSPDGTKIASGSQDKTIRVWDASSGVEVSSALRCHDNVVWSVGYSPDGSRIVSASHDRTIRVWEAPSSGNIDILPPKTVHEAGVTSVSFSPNGETVVSGSNDKTVRIWDVVSGAQVLPPFRGHDHPVWSTSFSTDGNRITSESRLESISWEATSGRRLPFADDPRYIGFGTIEVNRDGWVVDTATHRVLAKLPRMIEKISSAAYERCLAIGTANGRVVIIRFPPTLWTSSETRVVSGASREDYCSSSGSSVISSE